MIDRILKIIELEKLNKTQFYKKTGLSNGFLDKVRDVGASKLELILIAFPNINPEWLLTGKGEMLRNPEPKKEENNSGENYIEKLLATKDELISSQKVNIEVLLRYNKKLEDELKDVKNSKAEFTQDN